MKLVGAYLPNGNDLSLHPFLLVTTKNTVALEKRRANRTTSIRQKIPASPCSKASQGFLHFVVLYHFCHFIEKYFEVRP